MISNFIKVIQNLLKIFLKRGLRIMYPKEIVFEGVVYSVNVDYNSDGEIQWYELVGPDGVGFFEEDWEGGFTAEQVIKQIEWHRARN